MSDQMHASDSPFAGKSLNNRLQQQQQQHVEGPYVVVGPGAVPDSRTVLSPPQTVEVRALSQAGRPKLEMVYMPLASTGVTGWGIGVMMLGMTAGLAPPRPM